MSQENCKFNSKIKKEIQRDKRKQTKKQPHYPQPDALLVMFNLIRISIVSKKRIGILMSLIGMYKN